MSFRESYALPQVAIAECPHVQNAPEEELSTRTVYVGSQTPKGHERLLVYVLRNGDVACCHKGLEVRDVPYVAYKCTAWLEVDDELPDHGDHQQSRPFTTKRGKRCRIRTYERDGRKCTHCVMEVEDRAGGKKEILAVECRGA